MQIHYKLPLSVIPPTAICQSGHEFLFLWILASVICWCLTAKMIWFWIHLIEQPPFPVLHSHSLFFTVTMVMGIPTVRRKVKSYLSETLRSLIDKLSPEEKLDCVIIVFVGEVRSHNSYSMSHRMMLLNSKMMIKKSVCLKSVSSWFNLCRLTWTMFTA